MEPHKRSMSSAFGKSSLSSPLSQSRSLAEGFLSPADSTPVKRVKSSALYSTESSLPHGVISPHTMHEHSGPDLTSQLKKIFNDPIHGSIQLDEVTIRIIDTPEFQRLDRLKQLGTCSFVFRGAVHSRFEHSVGVSYLAETFVKHLQEGQPELGITQVDVLCVKLAGLCHDLGHGPFSHVYDGVFIPKMHKKYNKQLHWRHEDGSVRMFRHILDKNSISLAEYGIEPMDMQFIEEIIAGTPENKRKGRPPEKFFLYDIVNNSRSGLDVDKIDYFQRDMKASGVVFQTNFQRFFQLAKVLPSAPILGQSSLSIAKPLMICYPEKLVREAVDLFRVRFRMHGSVYTHKSVKQIEFMLTDALELADPFIVIRGSKTAEHPDGAYKISECIQDMEALSNLNDAIIEIIAADPRPELRPAQDIIQRVRTRQLYKFVGKSAFDRGDEVYRLSEDEIREELLEIAKQISSEGSVSFTSDLYDNDEDTLGYLEPSAVSQESSNVSCLTAADIIVEKMHIHYGLKQHNPVERMRFFSKVTTANPSASAFSGIFPASQTSTAAQTSAFGGLEGRPIDERVYLCELPKAFEEWAVRVYCRSTRAEAHAATYQAFERWCLNKRKHAPFPSLSQTAATPSQSNGYGFSQSYYP